jgi:hypothetical protein
MTAMMGEGQTLDAARAKIFEQVRANFDAFPSKKPAQPWLYWFGPTTTHRRWMGAPRDSGASSRTLKGKLPPSCQTA